MTNLLLKLFVKNHKNTADPNVRRSYGTLSGICGIILNILLFSIKLLAGILSGAISVIADAFNNLSDAGSSVVTLIGFKLASKKSDAKHPFGHGRIEYVSGLIVSFIIIMVGVELLKSSFEKILNPEPLSFGIVPIIILVVSILVKLFMAIFNRKLGKLINSSVLYAVSIDSISDVFATTAVLLGLVIARFSGFNPDGYIGLLVAGFIIFSGIKAANETLSPLLGAPPDPEFVEKIKSCVLAHDDIIGVHDLVIHDYGPDRQMISLHAEVPDTLSIVDIHDTIDLIEMELQTKFGCSCTIHMDPIAANDEFAKALKKQIKEKLNAIDERLGFHDFRYVTGQTHTNLIFDVEAPFDLKMSDDELTSRIKSAVHDIDESYFAVVQIDRGEN